MIREWQACQGDYKPASTFEQPPYMVLTRNIELLEEGVWKWEECRIPIQEYANIKTCIDEDATLVQTRADIDYILIMEDL